MRKRKLITKPIAVLLLGDMSAMIAGAMLAPLYALLVQKVGGDILDIGYVAAAFAAAAGCMALIAGRFAARAGGRTRIIGIGYILQGIGYLGYVFVHTMVELLVVQVFIGLAVAMYQSAYDSLYGQYAGRGASSSQQWSFWESGAYFAAAIGAMAGAALLSFMSFQAVFIAMAILCFIAAIVILVFGRKYLHR